MEDKLTPQSEDIKGVGFKISDFVVEKKMHVVLSQYTTNIRLGGQETFYEICLLCAPPDIR